MYAIPLIDPAASAPDPGDGHGIPVRHAQLIPDRVEA